AAVVVLQGGFLDALQAADAGADGHADALGVLARDLQAGVPDRHHRRRVAVVDEGIHLLQVLGSNPLRSVEVLDLAGDAGRERGGIEVGDRADARAPGGDPVPAGSQVIAQRREDAHTGDDHATLGHGMLLQSVRGGRAGTEALKRTGPHARPRVHRRAAHGPARGGTQLRVALAKGRRAPARRHYDLTWALT